MEWVMILSFTISLSISTPRVSMIGGFGSEKQCEMAAEKLKANLTKRMLTVDTACFYRMK